MLLYGGAPIFISDIHYFSALLIGDRGTMYSEFYYRYMGEEDGPFQFVQGARDVGLPNSFFYDRFFNRIFCANSFVLYVELINSTIRAWVPISSRFCYRYFSNRQFLLFVLFYKIVMGLSFLRGLAVSATRTAFRREEDGMELRYHVQATFYRRSFACVSSEVRVGIEGDSSRAIQPIVTT